MSGERVAFSVVVVTCGRPVELQRCLEHVQRHLRQPGVPTAEVLTVHAPGDERVMAMVRERFPWVAVHGSAVRNLCVQRNLGARLARGDVVVYLDDDAWPRDGWLPALARAFALPGVVAASGPVLFADGRRQYGRMAVSAMVRPIALADSAPVPDGMAPTMPGCNLALRRSALLAVGGFDERLSIHFDDVDLCLRLFAANGRRIDAFAWVLGAEVHHEPAPGPFRRTTWDRDWRTVARDSVYLAFRHGGAARWWRLPVPLLLQVPKAVRLWWWLLTGRLGPAAFARCAARHLLGIVDGYRKGFTTTPCLPLRPEPAAAPAAPTAAAAACATALR